MAPEYSGPAVHIAGLSHRYQSGREALHDLSLDIAAGEIFAIVGPNGSGKTTLFRIVSTLLPPQSGCVEVFGLNLSTKAGAARYHMGVVFQAPSLDKQLTVRENILCQAALYGLTRRERAARCDQLTTQFGLDDYYHERSELLSGGLRRRVELAKGMIHHPRLLLLDEPSTGLDPGARSDLWRYLTQLRDQSAVTVLLTTHLLEEAGRADRIAILNRGELVALDAPAALQASLGGDSLIIESDSPQALAKEIAARCELRSQLIDGSVRIENLQGGEWVGRLWQEFPELIRSIRLGKPTLEDVFIAKTGHRFWEAQEQEHVP